MASPMSADPAEHHQELIDRLDNLRTNQSFCDMTVAVKDGQLSAHKVVLAAASPFFFKLIGYNTRESKGQVIKIELEEATASVMEDVLQYIYTGNVLVSEESAHNLIATADYFLLPGLKTIGCNFLKENLTIENCIFNYYFADQYQCVELRGKAREVINSNFSVILETEDFLNLDKKQVMEWVSSDDITIKAEEEIFKGIVKWVSHSRSEREAHFAELFHHVRLMSVWHDFLENNVLKEELVINNSTLLDVINLMTSATYSGTFQAPRECLDTHKDAIFVCGGKKALCYLPKHNSWYSLTDMLYDHPAQHVVQCQDRVYIIDEEELCVPHSHLMEFYEPVSNSWGTIQRDITVTEPRSFAALQGHLYIAYDNGVTKYDPEKNSWEKLKDAPSRRFCPCVVVNEQHLYIIGGVSGLCTVSTTERFDPGKDEWEEVASVNEERVACFGTSMKGKIYIAGGRQYPNQELISTCEVYDPTRNEWQLMPSLKVPRWFASMVSHEERLYVLGGLTLDHNRRKRVLSVEMFDSERNEWENKSTIPVKRFGTAEARRKLNLFNACSVRAYKGVIEKT